MVDFELEEKPFAKFQKLAKKYTAGKQDITDDPASQEAAAEHQMKPPGRAKVIRYMQSTLKNRNERRFRVYDSDLSRAMNHHYYYESRWSFRTRMMVVFLVSLTLVAALIGIIFATLIYRIAVAISTYRVISRISGGLIAADYIVSFTALIIQVASIFILNMIYGHVADYLTAWG